MTKVQRTRKHHTRAQHQGLQTNLNYHTTGNSRYDNIEPSGDRMREREESDNYIRIAFQNIRGITRAEDIPSEIDAMDELGIDIMGMSETNCPWTPQTKVEYDLVMKEDRVELFTHQHQQRQTQHINQEVLYSRRTGELQVVLQRLGPIHGADFVGHNIEDVEMRE